MTTETKVQRKMPRQSGIEGVIHIAQPGQLANEFITSSKSFDEALAKCPIRDEQLRNAIICYKAQLDMFEMTIEIGQLTSWLTGSSAVGGFNRSIAAMVGTGVYIPEGAGIKLTKESEKALMELQKQRAMSGNKDNDKEKQQQ
jgi:hypothetical protein